MSKHHHKHDQAAAVPEPAEPGALATVQDRAKQAADGLVANPGLALLGGLAIGAIVGALVPRSARERDLLAPAGAKVGGAARAAYDAARAAGSEALDEAGLNQDNVRAQAARLFEQVIGAAGTAGKAAFVAARDAAPR